MVVLIRHGEAESNVRRIFDSSIDSRSHLTDVGIKQIEETSHKLKEYFFREYIRVSRIFCSPLLRTIETAKIFKKIMNENSLYKDDRFGIDYRIREIEMGEFDGKTSEEYPNGSWNFTENDKYGGENTKDVERRVGKFLKNLNKTNVNVVITHGEPFRRMVYLLTKQDIKPLRGQAIIIENIQNNIIFNTRDGN